MRGTRSMGYLAAYAVVGVAAVTALAGCNGPVKSAAHATKAVGSKAQGAVSSVKGHAGQVAPVGPAKPGVPNVGSAVGGLPVASGLTTCNVANLAKSFVVNAGDPGGLPLTDGSGTIVITNESSKPCILQGYIGLGMIGTNGQHLGLSDVHLSTANAPVKVDLSVGGSAYQGVDFASVAACPQVSDAQIALPNAPAPAVVPVHAASGGSQGLTGPLRVCPGPLNLGPVSVSQAEALVAIAHHAIPVPVNLPKLP